MKREVQLKRQRNRHLTIVRERGIIIYSAAECLCGILHGFNVSSYVLLQD